MDSERAPSHTDERGDRRGGEPPKRGGDHTPRAVPRDDLDLDLVERALAEEAAYEREQATTPHPRAWLLIAVLLGAVWIAALALLLGLL